MSQLYKFVNVLGHLFIYYYKNLNITMNNRAK